MTVINPEAIANSFFLITLLSILIERALALVFEQKYIAPKIDGKGVKDIIAFGVCWIVCYTWSIDVISVVLNKTEPSSCGFVITALAIAGGSKASIKLFQDVMGLKKE